MNLQQLEYLVAVNNYRHFVKAADACGVSQSTLSMMVRKLEEELDTIIFDREAHPVRPTAAGEKLIAQAEVVLYNTKQFREMAIAERECTGGDVSLAVIPTVAADVVPLLFRSVRASAPDINLETYEMKTCDIVEKLSKAELDMALMATPLDNPVFLEIPIYYEKFYAYISPSDPLYAEKEIVSSSLPTERLWALQEGNCMRGQIFNMCSSSSCYKSKFEAGSIDTLIRVVDENGGFTVIPELHLQHLSERQRANVRNLVSPDATREISLVIRKDFVREGVLNQIADALKKAIPDHMLDLTLKKFAIRL